MHENNLLSLKEQEESYLACKSLKRKAPNLKLNCEKLIPKKVEEAKEIQNINSEIKILRTSDTGTRKINKIEEIKLRNLIWKLAYENTIRTD